MRICFTFLLISILQTHAFTQSPFNYGQDEKIFFLSSQNRINWGISDMYAISQYKEGETGGMSENGSLYTISFGSDFISDYWTPVYQDSGSNFNTDLSSLLDLEPLNGMDYEFAEGELLAYGGSGYGAFDYKEIFRPTQQISVILTRCTGHCGGNNPIIYSKNVFDKHGRLIYTITYPEGDKLEAPEYDVESMATQELDECLNSTVSHDRLPDTLYSSYNNKGHLIRVDEHLQAKELAEVEKLFVSEWGGPLPFYQCYIGEEKMEDFIRQKMGFMPELLLVEIYRYGVFSFWLNPSERKYYRGETVILER